MLIIAALITFALTAVFSMAGVGAAFVLIPVFLALGVELHSAMATALLLNAIGMSIASLTFVRKGLVAWRLAGERETARRSAETNHCPGTDRRRDQDRLGVVVNRIFGKYP